MAKVTMPNNMYIFYCVHYKVSHRDKNIVSYNMMFKLCTVYKGLEVLKMYPTWDKNDQAKKTKIGFKYGMVFSLPLSSLLSPRTQPPHVSLMASPPPVKAY